MSRQQKSQESLTAFSRYIDENQPDGVGEVTWSRLAKIAEQAGEALGDHIRSQGRNILKQDFEVSNLEVRDRVLSVAFTALATYEHLTGNRGLALGALDDKIAEMGDLEGDG